LLSKLCTTAVDNLYNCMKVFFENAKQVYAGYLQEVILKKALMELKNQKGAMQNMAPQNSIHREE
jgi:hypothetical protein